MFAQELPPEVAQLFSNVLATLSTLAMAFAIALFAFGFVCAAIGIRRVAKKLTITDALCDTANFKALIRPAGETANQLAAARRQFAMDEIKAWLNAKVAQNRERIIEEAKAKADVSDLP